MTEASAEPDTIELQTSQWFNVKEPLTLETLRGRVIVLHTFQMLCPGCVQHGVPQAQRVRETFAERDVAVVGLHTVFEHHEVMTPAALAVYIHENRLRFPIGVDAAVPGQDVPATMAALGLQGTPSLLLIDRRGRLRVKHFGQIDDLALGAMIGQLMAEPVDAGD